MTARPKRVKRFAAYHTEETIEFLKKAENVEACDCRTTTELERLIVEKGIQDLRTKNLLCLNRSKATAK